MLLIAGLEVRRHNRRNIEAASAISVVRVSSSPGPSQRNAAGVSVIVPCRNAGPHLKDLLESLIHQELREAVEIVVVDNGSTDGSRDTVQRASGCIPVVLVDGTGPANGSWARNLGVRACSGSKLLFVDADDEVAPGYLAAMSEALNSHEYVTSRVDSITLNAEWLRAAHGPPWEGVQTYFGFMPGTGVNIGIRRPLFERVGGFPEDFTGSQDIAFSWAVQLAGAKIHFVPEALYRYRYRATLAALYRQTRNWGFSNVLLYRRFRSAGMPGRTAGQALREWCDTLRGLAQARTRADLAPRVARLGYCVGRLHGSIRYKELFL